MTDTKNNVCLKQPPNIFMAFSRWSWLAPVFLGLVAFLLVVGPRILYTSNISWLGIGDPAQHFLGWNFFRSSEWSFPIGLNPSFGLELSGSIVFSDSNPLFAFVFKVFADVLPDVFQYFGIWVLICFILQAFFGWRLAGLVSGNKYIRLLISVFFTFSPPMIWRLHGHFSLVGHFLILAAIYFVFLRQSHRRIYYWVVLLIIAALVHAYLLAMVFVIWAADNADRLVRGERSPQKMLTENALVAVTLSFVCWQAGYFVVGEGTSIGGYGYYRMNLLSPFDASGWSYLLSDLPEKSGDYEGFNYLGLGALIIAPFALLGVVRRRSAVLNHVKRRPFFLLILLGLSIFSISNNIGFGITDFRYPLPSMFDGLLNTFRASGRMFWPVFYMIFFLTFYGIVRAYRVSTAMSLLLVGVSLQIVDSSAGWRDIRAKLMTGPSEVWPTPLVDPFWQVAALKYSKVRWMLPDNHSPHWLALSAYAAQHELATNAVYLARIDNEALARARSSAALSISSGRYDPDTIYILDEKSFRIASLHVDSESHLLARIDGLNIIAPGWKKCSDCPLVSHAIDASAVLPTIKPGTRLSVGASGMGINYLAWGWSYSENWGTWTEGTASEILLPIPKEAALVRLEVNALVNSGHPSQNLNIKIDGHAVFNESFQESAPQQIEFSIPDSARQCGLERCVIKLEMYMPDAVRPIDIDAGMDVRKLAFGLHSITLI